MKWLCLGNWWRVGCADHSGSWKWVASLRLEAKGTMYQVLYAGCQNCSPQGCGLAVLTAGEGESGTSGIDWNKFSSGGMSFCLFRFLIFTVLCWHPLHNGVNQPRLHIHPLPLEPHPLPYSPLWVITEGQTGLPVLPILCMTVSIRWCCFLHLSRSLPPPLWELLTHTLWETILTTNVHYLMCSSVCFYSHRCYSFLAITLVSTPTTLSLP